MHQLENVHVDPQTLSAAYQLYRRQQHFMECCEGQQRWQCPVCAVFMHSGHADGNMKLFVYKSNNKTCRESCYEGDQGAIFVPDRWGLHNSDSVERGNGNPAESALIDIIYGFWLIQPDAI